MQPAAETAGSVGAGVDPERRAREATVPNRPLSFRELVDIPFALLQADIAILAGYTAVLLIVGEALVAGVIGLVSRLTDGSDTGTALAAVFGTATIAWILRAALRGPTVAIGLTRADGRPILLRDSLRWTGARLGPLLLTQLSFTAIGVGALAASAVFFPISVPLAVIWFLFVYPLCLFWLAWLRARHLAAVPVLLAEQTTARAALARSGLLTGDLRMQRTGLWLCRQLLFTLLAAPLLGLLLFISEISGTHRWAFLVLSTSAALVLIAVAEIVESCARTTGYLDLRCRREGTDIRVPVGGGR